MRNLAGAIYFLWPCFGALANGVGDKDGRKSKTVVGNLLATFVGPLVAIFGSLILGQFSAGDVLRFAVGHAALVIGGIITLSGLSQWSIGLRASIGENTAITRQVNRKVK